jgi:uncharacterized protein YqfA (UPF0365 family)
VTHVRDIINRVLDAIEARLEGDKPMADENETQAQGDEQPAKITQKDWDTVQASVQELTARLAKLEESTDDEEE